MGKFHQFPEQEYRDWTVTFDPTPLPVRDFDWVGIHRDYDATMDDGKLIDSGLKVHGSTLAEVIAAIDAAEAEYAACMADVEAMARSAAHG